MVRSGRNPFKPGAGQVPPLRAGHEDAAAHLAWRLGLVRNGKEGGTVVLFGPRGSGKTALLGELHRKAEDEAILAVGLKTREMVGSSVTLAKLLATEAARTKSKAKGRKVGAGDFGGEVKFEGSVAPSAGNVLRRHLKKPLLLTVDEAHEMPVGLGKVLLQTAQDCVSRRLPLLVVLAGTPGLPIRLGDMRAGFWERDTRLQIGRLETDEAVREALARPAKDSGMPIDADALESLVEESQRYPFFVQRLGYESWDAARQRKGNRRIALEDAQKGIAVAGKNLQTFYSDCRREAGEQGVLGEAEAVSRMVVAKGRDAQLTTAELMDAVKSVAIPAGRDPGESWEKLVRLGLVWEPSEPDLWEPGIPSLCRYVVDKVGVPVPKKRPA